MGRLILLLLLLAHTAAAEPTVKPKYVHDMHFCEKNADCALREGSCGVEPMNVYFDNSPLLEQRPFIECDRPPFYADTRCEAGRCTADILEPPDHLDAYLSDMNYCEKDSDCALRQGMCIKEPMNVYFDNRPLIAQQPMVKCSTLYAYANPRCEKNLCVGDMKTLAPIPAPAPEE